MCCGSKDGSITTSRDGPSMLPAVGAPRRDRILSRATTKPMHDSEAGGRLNSLLAPWPSAAPPPTPKRSAGRSVNMALGDLLDRLGRDS